MLFVIPNYNPSLGPVKGNQQGVSVYDRALGNRRTVITTPEEAEEFIKDRNSVISHANKTGFALAGLTTAAATGISAGISYAKNNNLNKLIDELNPQIKDFALKHNKDGYTLRDAFLKHKDISSSKLKHTFDILENNFKKVNVKSNVKEAVLITGIMAGIFSLLIPSIKAENADKKITNEFINANK